MADVPVKPHPIRLTDLNLSGFAAENTLGGSTVRIVVRANLTSDQSDFYVFMQSISAVIGAAANKAGTPIMWDTVGTFLVCIHSDNTADLSLRNVPVVLEILLSKGPIEAGDMVDQSSIADVRRVRISGVEFQPDDRVIVCIKVGWKFALHFDLASERDLNVDAMERDLGALYRFLSYQDLYEAIGDEEIFGKLVRSGWFPFIEIIGGEFQLLLKAVREEFDLPGQKENLVKKFDEPRIEAIWERWRNRPSLKGREKFLRSALDAFGRNDPIACLKIILTEMEGIIQDAHLAEVGNGASIKDLLNFAAKKGAGKAGDEGTLLFPKHFLRYLSDHTYARFDPKNPDDEVFSRHSVGHGGAKSDFYTQERALQAILTLDQLSYYL